MEMLTLTKEKALVNWLLFLDTWNKLVEWKQVTEVGEAVLHKWSPKDRFGTTW